MSEFTPLSLEEFREKFFPDIPKYDICDILLEDYYNHYLSEKLEINTYIELMEV